MRLPTYDMLPGTFKLAYYPVNLLDRFVIGSCDPLSELCCTCVTLIPKISNAIHAEAYQELAPIRVMGASRHPSPLLNKIWFPRQSVKFLSGWKNSQHPFHYQEIASIMVRGLHRLHPNTQQNLVTKAVSYFLKSF